MPIIPPDYGTGSSYYSQNFDNIQELLQRIYDNTNNVIVAKDVRDPLWTLWNKISGLSASLGSASISYSLGTPSTISVGGIPEGTTFSNVTLTQLFDQMLLPYVAPVVNNFGPSVLEKQFGDTTTLNLTYSINVGSLPLDGGYAIQFISPNPSSSIPNKVVTGNDPETGTTNNFSLTYSTATISVVSYAVATMSFRTTPDLTIFTATTSIAQKHKRYYGQISIPIGFTPSNPASVAAVGAYLTDTRIKGLSYSELSTNVNFSQAVDFDSSGQYFVFAAPTIFGFNYPIGFYVDNIFTQNYTKIRSNSNLSNEFGFVAPYDVFIINDKLIDPSLISTVPLPQGYLGNLNSVIPSVIIGDQGPQGPTGNGAVTYTVTRAQLTTLITNSGLIPNALYKITDAHKNHNVTYQGNTFTAEALYDDGLISGVTIYLKAISTNELESEGYGEFYVPKLYSDDGLWTQLIEQYSPTVEIELNTVSGIFQDRENITANNGATGILISTPVINGTLCYIQNTFGGDWTTATNFVGDTSTAITTIQSASLIDSNSTTVQAGDLRQYGGYIWECNTNGNYGTFTDHRTLTGWTKIDYTTGLTAGYYVKNIDKIIYNVEHDLILGRFNSESSFNVEYSPSARAIFSQVLYTYLGNSTVVSPISVFDWCPKYDYFDITAKNSFIYNINKFYGNQELNASNLDFCIILGVGIISFTNIKMLIPDINNTQWIGFTNIPNKDFKEISNSNINLFVVSPNYTLNNSIIGGNAFYIDASDQNNVSRYVEFESPSNLEGFGVYENCVGVKFDSCKRITFEGSCLDTRFAYQNEIEIGSGVAISNCDFFENFISEINVIDDTYGLTFNNCIIQTLILDGASITNSNEINNLKGNKVILDANYDSATIITDANSTKDIIVYPNGTQKVTSYDNTGVLQLNDLTD